MATKPSDHRLAVVGEVSRTRGTGCRTRRSEGRGSGEVGTRQYKANEFGRPALGRARWQRIFVEPLEHTAALGDERRELVGGTGEQAIGAVAVAPVAVAEPVVRILGRIADEGQAPRAPRGSRIEAVHRTC
jgi:hypothetical protein